MLGTNAAHTQILCKLYKNSNCFYDLILLDIKMPVLNGFELCKKIIELDRTVHILFITASEEYYEKFRSQHYPELGMINYIQKPIGNDELVRLVNAIIGNSITVD
jgi:two-component SAPR family response regulator